MLGCGAASGRVIVSGGEQRGRVGAHRRRRRDFVGWNFRTARGANADLKVHKGRIPGFRRARNSNGLWSIVLVVLTLLS